MRISSAGIIAAGEGSRFKKSGITIHKPMIPVASFPLIGHTLKNLEFVGIKRAVIILNESERSCVRWVKKNFLRLRLEFIVKSTKSSFESFWLVGQKLGAGRHLICTVDSICLPQELKKMVQVSEPAALRASNGKSDNLYLGVTSFVDDEKPLWVIMDNETNQILRLGDPPTTLKSGRQYATAGFYNVPDLIFRSLPKEKILSLRWYLGWLLQKGFPIYGVPLKKVVDVDTPKDIHIAEKFLKEGKRERVE